MQSSPDWHSSFFMPEQSPLGKIPTKNRQGDMLLLSQSKLLTTQATEVTL